MAEVKEQRSTMQFSSTMDPCDMDGWIRKRFEIPYSSTYTISLEGEPSDFGTRGEGGRVEGFRLGNMRMVVSWEE